MIDSDLLSCAAENIYSSGYSYIPEDEYRDLLKNSLMYNNCIEVVQEIFPSTDSIQRGAGIIVSNDTNYGHEVSHHNAMVQRDYNKIPKTLLVKIKKAAIWNGLIFVDVGDCLMPIYEMYRPNDRHEKKAHVLGRLAACRSHETIMPDGRSLLFAGSADSFNYGHWLADDFPLLAGAVHMHERGLSPLIVMTGYSEGINKARIDGSEFAYKYACDASHMFIDINTVYHVSDLYYVTPCTYHPYLKNPHAIAFARNLCEDIFYDAAIEGKQDKIFVNRDVGSSRRVINNAEVVAFLESQGYSEVIPEKLDFHMQAGVFHRASDVVGIMGASMTNSLFCPTDANITYLAPKGWIEPFYWDLAASCGHHYSVIYGEIGSNAESYQNQFSIDIKALASVLRQNAERTERMRERSRLIKSMTNLIGMVPGLKEAIR